jgi:hypothetical protein
MEKFRMNKTTIYRMLTCFLIVGLLSSVMLFSQMMKCASSRIQDKSGIQHMNSLMVGDYFLN